MPDSLIDPDRSDVLVLDGDQPSALSIVRALGRHGLRVRAAAASDNTLAGHSRHAAQTLRYPDPLTDQNGFLDWLRAQLADARLGMVVPVTERTVVPLWRHHATMNDPRIAIAPPQALEMALDKQRTLALATSLGIPVPRSVTLSHIDQLADAAAAFGFPVVVKPARSMGHDGQQQLQLSVTYAHDPAGLQAQVRHALRYGQVILQEFFRGEGVGVELIAERGTVRHAFQHRRLHEVPLTGGGSSLRVSEPVVPALLNASSQLMRASGWHGVAMVEFKYAPDTGDFRLMEINGRFWGSLPLAVAAGANFPVMLHELVTTGRVGAHPPSRDGVLCRQLARDIDWLEHVVRRAAPPQLVRLPTLGDALRDSLLVLSPRHHFDVQSWRDPKPGWIDLKRIVARQWSRVTELLRHRRDLAQARQAAGRQGAGRTLVDRAGQVLFLCHGNINRSALAHAYAQARFGQGLKFLSAGFHPNEGRPADPVMVETASRHGVDLAGWSSHALTAAQVAQADVILAMELVHLERLVALHPAARGKAFLLGAAAGDAQPVEVPDPYGQAPAVYERVCRHVLVAVDGWFANRATTPPPQAQRSSPQPSAAQPPCP